MPKTKLRPVKSVTAWAGISDGKLHCWGGENKYYEIYPTRKLAALNYEHFTRVKIFPIASTRKQKAAR